MMSGSFTPSITVSNSKFTQCYEYYNNLPRLKCVNFSRNLIFIQGRLFGPLFNDINIAEDKTVQILDSLIWSLLLRSGAAHLVQSRFC